MPVIPLLPNAPHQTMGHSHPNGRIPMPPKLSLPTSQQLHHCFRHNQWIPIKVNTIDHKSKAIEQWMRRWSTDFPFLLHIQHQSKIKICRFLILSIVKIFSKVAVHTKRATLEGTLDFQTIFQGKDWLKLFVSTW